MHSHSNVRVLDQQISYIAKSNRPIKEDKKLKLYKVCALFYAHINHNLFASSTFSPTQGHFNDILLCFVTLQMTEERSPPHPQEQPGRTISLDISSDSYFLFEDKKFVVKAFRLFHRIPSFGFCIQERDRPGRLKTEILKDLGNFTCHFIFSNQYFYTQFKKQNVKK